MTSMVLLEAHLSGVATLSFQPGRTDIPNPAIEFAAEVVTDPQVMSAAVSTFMGRLGGRSAPHPRFQAALEDASKRFADAVEARVLC